MKKIFAFCIKYKLFHILFWAAYFYNYVINVFIHGGRHRSVEYTVTICAVATFITIVCTYINVHFLQRFFLSQLRKVKYLFAAIVSTITFSTIVTYAETIVKQGFHIQTKRLLPIQTLSGHFIDLMILTIAFGAVSILYAYIQNLKRNHTLEKEKIENELHYLKQQINPHFLFNAINSIFVLIDEDKDKARRYLHQFSSMLRYQLYECIAETVTVAQELNFIKSYCEIELLRKSEQLKSIINIQEPNTSLKIAPAILITFIENAFKHLREHPISKEQMFSISIQFEGNYLNMEILNSFNRHHHKKETESGIGLSNVQRRLALLYPNKHQLQHHVENNYYSVHLKLECL